MNARQETDDDYHLIEAIVTGILSADPDTQAELCAGLSPESERLARAGAMEVAGVVLALSKKMGWPVADLWQTHLAYLTARRAAETGGGG